MTLVHGPNVILAEKFSRNKRYGIMGVSNPTMHPTTFVYIQDALDCFAALRKPVILAGDLNITLHSPESTRGVEKVKLAADTGLIDMQHHLKKDRRSHSTWPQKFIEEIVWSQPDYCLGMDRKIIYMFKIQDLRHFVINHKLICGYLISDKLQKNKRYVNDRTCFPHQTLTKMGPSNDGQFVPRHQDGR